MIEHRPFASLHRNDHGWLDTRFHFSFADYHDPKRLQWGKLRVWNDDVIAAHSGFPPHSHRDMEIITYVRSGAITHEDDLGNKGRTEAGDVQVMSAGTGITHAEYNREDEETRIFQLWIMPDRKGVRPAWDARPFPKAGRAGRLVPLASGRADDGALSINADARVLGATLPAGEALDYALAPGRKAYLVPATGALELSSIRLDARDGAAIADVPSISITALEDSELVLVDSA